MFVSFTVSLLAAEDDQLAGRSATDSNRLRSCPAALLPPQPGTRIAVSTSRNIVSATVLRRPSRCTRRIVLAPQDLACGCHGRPGVGISLCRGHDLQEGAHVLVECPAAGLAEAG